MAGGGRTQERVRAHYEVEVELADRLRHAPPEERRRLYGEVYDELFRRVPDHPQLVRREDSGTQAAYAERQVALIREFLPAGGSYVEIGAGDCATVRRVARFASTATAVEVSADIVPFDLPSNVRVVISDGVSVPVAGDSADVVYSNQLMEHLHPEDAIEQLRNIADVLRPGGRYICITPNRLSGPHDISAAFDAEARGFHLHEYTYRELVGALRRAGFRRIRVAERAEGRAFARLVRHVSAINATAGRRLEGWGTKVITLPLAPYLVIERFAAAWPAGAVNARLLRRLLGMTVVAER